MHTDESEVVPSPADFNVSASNASAESGILRLRCARVPAPLIPLVAFVEFPPQNDDLSKRSTRPP